MQAERLLILFRHGHSSQPQGVADHDRPLASDGKEDVAWAAAKFANQGLLPEVILCSTAKRTRETASIFCETSQCTADIIFLNHLYLADAQSILGTISTMPEETLRIMVIGHNPGINCLAHDLAPRLLCDHTMTPSALASFKINAPNWEFVDSHSAELQEFIAPELKEADLQPRVDPV